LSIDELPQLVNVLRGEMSLVGPRPEMPYIVKRYNALERRRLSVKPGMTGLWQISPARSRPIHENLEYDLFYIRRQSMALDCAILLRTITAVVRGVGAA
jgi:lipopolysaccharide/colanic/teichoic acid biosynthesis glycosyltransferase